MRGLLLSLLFMPLALSAQVFTSELGRFEVRVTERCQSFSVEVTETFNPPTLVASYQYDTNGGSGETNSLTHTYAAGPGTYVITQIIQNLSPATDRVTVSIPTPEPPKVQFLPCTSNRLQVDVTGGAYDSYVVTFGDGNQTTTGPVSSVNHLYGGFGPWTATVRGRYADVPADVCPTAEATFFLPTATPGANITSVVPVDAATAGLTFGLVNDIPQLLQVSQGQGGFVTVDTLYNETTYQLAGLNQTGTFHRLQLAGFNACDNTSFPGTETSTINVSVSPQPDGNQVTWTSGGSPTDHEVLRDGTVVAGPTADRQLLDADVLCEVDYCYVVQATIGAAAVQSLSACATSESGGAANSPSLLNASVEGDSVVLTWQPTAGQTSRYLLFRRRNDPEVLEPTAIAQPEATASTFVDLNVSPGSRSYCYAVSAQNNCATTPVVTDEVCTLLLTQVDEELLQFAPQQGWATAPSGYVLQVADGQAVLLEEQAVTPDTPLPTSDLGLSSRYPQFRICAENTDGLLAYSNVVELVRPLPVQMPTAFRPGGVSGDFRLQGALDRISGLEMSVFNRWGELVFVSSDTQTAWNGTTPSGSPASEGTYAYKVRFLDEVGTPVELAGLFLLVR